jgi:hypothetical protein
VISPPGRFNRRLRTPNAQIHEIVTAPACQDETAQLHVYALVGRFAGAKLWGRFANRPYQVHPSGEKGMEPLGIELGEKTAESVVEGDCIRQFEKLLDLNQ